MCRMSILLLTVFVLVVGQAAGGTVLAQSGESPSTLQGKGDKAGDKSTWCCAVHPQVRQDEAGKCPICAMQLVPVEKPSVVRQDTKRQRLIREEILPKARQILELRTAEYQSGTADMLVVAAAHRELLELQMQLAETKAEKITVVEAQKRLMQTVRDITSQRFQAGHTTRVDVLAIELELSKLDLRLLDLRGE